MEAVTAGAAGAAGRVGMAGSAGRVAAAGRPARVVVGWAAVGMGRPGAMAGRVMRAVGREAWGAGLGKLQQQQRNTDRQASAHRLQAC